MAVVYLDASAGAKLVMDEPESHGLKSWLADRVELASSALFGAELLRAVHRAAPHRIRVARDLLATLTLLAIDDDVLTAAANLEPATLRTLDAIHVASAIRLGSELDALVTYDRRMIEAAERIGLPVASPA